MPARNNRRLAAANSAARYSFLPGYSRIEAWYAVAPIGIFPRDIHLPYQLRTIGLGDLRDLGPRTPCGRRRVEFHVSVAQNSYAPSTAGKVTGEVLPERSGKMRVLVYLEERNADIAGC
jgi:hypothetical protein